MPKYLFSNDQRISELADRIKWVSEYVLSGKNLKDIPGKSDNNNAATLEFYYNLYPDTDNTKIAITSPTEVIRNFVLKFQFPNTRTVESFKDTLSENVYLAPFRMVASILLALHREGQVECYLTLKEILRYVFSDSQICKNPSIDCGKIAKQIITDRIIGKDYDSFISVNLEWNHYERQVREMMTVFNKCCESFSVSKGCVFYKEIDVEKDFVKSLVNYDYFWTPSQKDNFDLSHKEYISYMNMADTPYNVVEFPKEETLTTKKNNLTKPLQQIYYGAPGTGKSYAIDKITKVYDTIRTTFHPDSDYSTFVGAYKPSMTKVKLRDVSGHTIMEGGKEVLDDRITYKFVKQAFLKAYLAAWKKYAEAKDEGVVPQFLVIEEINRGNCAQIFGDLFQLLDRQDNGFSSYPIEADADLQREIETAFAEGGEYKLPKGGLDLHGAVKDYAGDLSADITSGKILLLPCNLYIWATMNTSDQSLFPIDSAFKRRWDWKYVKIADAHKDFKIKCGDESCDWWTFVTMINEKIATETSSDDKKLGYFFCKPTSDDNLISEERFVSKVLFYLWNDVFKDGTTTDFKVSDNVNEQPSFDAFYNDDNSVNVANVRKFLVNIVGELNLVKCGDSDDEEYNGQKESEDDHEHAEWTETEKKRYEYWEAFLKYAPQKNADFANYFGGVKKASKDAWKNFSVTGTDFYLCAIQQRRNHSIGMQVYFGETTDEYHKLLAHQNEIEEEMGVQYKWEEKPEKKASIISETKLGVDFEDKSKWPEQFDFIIDRLLKMRATFLKYAKIND